MRWLGKEQFVKDSLITFYFDGFKDGAVLAVVVCLALLLAYNLTRKVLKRA